MASPAKFMFDVDFAPGPKTANTVSLADHHARLADAEAEAYRKGFAAAQAEGAAQGASALARIGDALSELARGFSQVEKTLETEAVEIAVAVARKLAPELMAREPTAEICALARDCFRQLVKAPHVAVRVNDALYESARGKLDVIARECGFDGKLMVLGEPDIAPGDCRIEWADGGVTRDQKAVETAIAGAVGRYIKVRRAGIVNLENQ